MATFSMAAFRLLWLASAASAAAPAAAGAAVAAPTAPAKVPDDPLLLCLERFAAFDGALKTDGVVEVCRKVHPAEMAVGRPDSSLCFVSS